jgi:nucleoside 2-deoxyribosyltransferase
MGDKPLVYLLSPYWNNLKYVRLIRYQLATQVTAIMLQEGMHVFSPISAYHNLSLEHPGIPEEHFKELDRQILLRSDIGYVLMIPGWDKSKGIADETKLALEHKIPISYFTHEDFLGGSTTWKL